MITIFTPVYNRAYIIENLYVSLLRQTCYAFEWLIVDDGSTDDVISLVERWRKNTQEFQIRIYRQENRGKHSAINYGVKLAEYEAFFIVDSDDYLEDDAVETVLEYWSGIHSDCQFAGISGLIRNKHGKMIGGTPCFREYIDATNLEREKFGLEGDKAEVLKTEILRRFPFPEYTGETFITEAVVWDRIAYEGYKIRWINKSFKICDYLEDGLTAMGDRIFMDNPKGWAHYIRTESLYRPLEKGIQLKKCYYYYECECTMFTNDEIQKLLNLNSTDFEAVTNQYHRFKQKLASICDGKDVCIYGYGQWGRRIKKYLDDLKIAIKYVIDQKYKEIVDVTSYSIEMDLPGTDLIFIALNMGAEEVAETVKNKMQETDVILCKDIIPALW
ncbi:glycosyltransferase family A protein [Lachnospiraceae bacterium 48-21]